VSVSLVGDGPSITASGSGSQITISVTVGQGIVALTNSTPAGLGTAAVGTSSDAARADHVHAKSSVYTYGTAAPSGGADGDLYFQHT
jgi:hypothetical protein